MLYDDRVCKEVLSKSRVLSIFGATLPASNELISWTKKSDDIFFWFFERTRGSIHQKKLFGRCYDRSTRLNRISIENVTDNSEISYVPTWRAWVTAVAVFPRELSDHGHGALGVRISRLRNPPREIFLNRAELMLVVLSRCWTVTESLVNRCWIVAGCYWIVGILAPCSDTVYLGEGVFWDILRRR